LKGTFLVTNFKFSKYNFLLTSDLKSRMPHRGGDVRYLSKNVKNLLLELPTFFDQLLYVFD